MWADDINLVSEMVAKYGPVEPVFVEAGGLEDPTIASYEVTIEKMLNVPSLDAVSEDRRAVVVDHMRRAQMARYQRIHRPLEGALPSYVCEDPGAGGVSIEGLAAKYPKVIGCLVCLSTLEHVDEPWYAPEQMHDACRPGALVIVSVPWMFPHHASPPSFHDHWRFSPTGLDILFRSPTDGFEKLESGWRLDIPADAGVMDIHTGRPQAIQSAYWVGRVR